MTPPSHEGMITPPATPVWNQPSSKFSSSIPVATHTSTTTTASYPSPTSSSSQSSPSVAPPMRPSFSTRNPSIRENVQVMVRCRPRSEKELKYDEEPCWLIRPEEGSIELARLKTPTSIRAFHYDNVVMGVDNSQVYKAGICNLVRSAMMGYNGTVFAYGQTASGKTYTMMGTEKEPGVIPRAVEDVFSYIEEDTTGREYLLRVSYMEIYNEKIKDLLNTENTSPEIVEDKKGVYVRNLKEVIVKTSKEVMGCIKEGEGNRHISATDYNEHSSRSHTIFQLVIESRSKGMPTNANRGVRVSQLNLIDLAGSEKVATDIERRKEGGYINKSLLTLGNVISKLTSDEPALHIPFRNSKLTRILQAALSGNARISVICTINPTFASKDESLNTLRFAQRTKLVKTAAKMTRILDNSELQNCLLKIAELQTKMQEKNDLEAETRERLRSLLGLILTSSKEHDSSQDPNESDSFALLSNLSSDDLLSESTMRDVVAKCEEGFAAQITAHQKQMDKMTMNVESMQDMLEVMESAHTKQQEALHKRDAQIDKLKQELAAAKAAAMSRSSKIPMGSIAAPPPPSPVPPVLETMPEEKEPESSVDTSKVTLVEDMAPAISLAVQKITSAISSGLHLEDEEEEGYDMLMSTAPSTTEAALTQALQSVLQSALSTPAAVDESSENAFDTAAITHAIQNAVQASAMSSSVVSSSRTSSSEFISIHEAASFLQFSDRNSSSDFVDVLNSTSALVVEPSESATEENEQQEEQEELPVLVSTESHLCQQYDETDSAEEADDEDEVFWTNKNMICNSSDDSDIESEQHQELPSPPPLPQKQQLDDQAIEEQLQQQELQQEQLQEEQLQEEQLQEEQLQEEIESYDDTTNYEPYTASIKQPSPTTFVFNKYTLLAAVAYFLTQY